jgi:hypothetical protein
MSRFSGTLVSKFGTTAGALVLVVSAAKLARCAYASRELVYPALVFTLFFFHFDYPGASETFLLDMFVVTILMSKFSEWHQKLRFAWTYTAPWNAREVLGSGFHAALYLWHIPHTMSLVANAALAAVFSAPLYPFRGSSVFLVSYMRPLRFWERERHTVHKDDTTARLAAAYDPGARASNLNSLFYEHQLMRLKQQLARDMQAGLFGAVQPGDVFILLDSDNRMTSFLHIVEVGSGVVGFQLRGLEFAGTYCQARELAALEQDARTDRGLCCISTAGGLPGLLACNPLVRLRWQTWQQINAGYLLPDSYSVSLIPAVSMFQSFELRQTVIGYLTRAIVYFALSSPALGDWLATAAVADAVGRIHAGYVDVDHSFSPKIDPDFDMVVGGISMQSFYAEYGDWIRLCWRQRQHQQKGERDEALLDSVPARFSFMLAMLGRRLIHSHAFDGTDGFLQSFHALFKGDMQPTASKDEWVFSHVTILKDVIHQAVRITLRLHQDHFADPSGYDDPRDLFDAIAGYLGTGPGSMV